MTEVRLVGEAAFERDLGERPFGGAQQLGRVLDAQIADVIGDGAVEVMPELPCDVSRMPSGIPCSIVQRHAFSPRFIEHGPQSEQPAGRANVVRRASEFSCQLERQSFNCELRNIIVDSCLPLQKRTDRRCQIGSSNLGLQRRRGQSTQNVRIEIDGDDAGAALYAIRVHFARWAIKNRPGYAIKLRRAEAFVDAANHGDAENRPFVLMCFGSQGSPVAEVRDGGAGSAKPREHLAVVLNR